VTQFVWRFYVAEDGGWRWQKLSSERQVIAECPISHPDYESCVVAAHAEGYVHAAAQGRLTRPGNAELQRRR
jgi:hypothetical protein